LRVGVFLVLSSNESYAFVVALGKACLAYTSLWDWVIAAGVERVAAKDALERHPPSFDSPVFEYGLEAVVGTGGVETASIRWESMGEGLLVETDQGQEHKARKILRREREFTQGGRAVLGDILGDDLSFSGHGCFIIKLAL
jgi:hypothetical protein